MFKLRSTLLLTLFGTAICIQAQHAVPTQHNDQYRTGAYLQESVLTPAEVNPATGRGMRLRVVRPVDGDINAQLLYMPGLQINGAQHNVIFAATRNNVVYAYDADDMRDSGLATGLLWSRTLPVTTDPQRPLVWGIGSTPVIDPDTNKMYVVYAVTNGRYPNNGVGDGSDVGFLAAYHLAVLDITTGTVLRDVEIAASVRTSAGLLTFKPEIQWHRAGLLLSRHHRRKFINVAFCSRWREETIQYHGWVIQFDARTLSRRRAFCTTPDRRADSEGAGIWQGGGGLAGDGRGSIYFTTGNGPGSPGSYGADSDEENRSFRAEDDQNIAERRW